MMTPEEYNDLEEGSDQESHLANVGFLATGQQMDVRLGGMHNFLLSVFIEAPYRGCGIFKKLYKFVENTVLRDRLSVGMRLYVDKENTRAFETYKRLGMVKDNYDMWVWKKPKHLLPAHAGEEVPLPAALNLPEQFPEKYPWKIRLAEAADLPALVDLELRNAKETINDVNKFHFDETSCKKGYAMAWACPELARVYVAEMTETVPSETAGGSFTINRIVGMVTVTNEYSEWNAGVMAWLTSIYVIPPLRKHGVFTSLFQFAKSEVVKDPNVVGIRMLTIGKEHALAEKVYHAQQNLAKKIGLTQENYDLMHAIDPNSRTNLAEHFAGGHHNSSGNIGTPTPSMQ